MLLTLRANFASHNKLFLTTYIRVLGDSIDAYLQECALVAFSEEAKGSENGIH